jgi:hypothetical protein
MPQCQSILLAAAGSARPLLAQKPCPRCTSALHLQFQIPKPVNSTHRQSPSPLQVTPPRYSHRHRCGTLPPQISIAEPAARPTSVHPAVSSLAGFRTPAPERMAPSVMGRHPKTFTTAAVSNRSKAAHYSITSSARASRVGGTVRPSACAVIRFTTRSNLVGCSTGISAG